MLSELPTKHASSSVLLSSSFGYVLLCKLTNNGLPFKRFLKFKNVVNPFAPGDFAEKRVLKLVEWFSGHCHAIKS